MEQDQWHYNDEQTKKRLGPVDRDEVARLIATDRIDRATLVWNPAMPEWARASTTDLANLFRSSPPPLPATAISRWAVYALALFPLWGLVIQALSCAAFSGYFGLGPRDMFDHWAWLLFYVAGNGVLGDLDERNLKRGGLKIRGAVALAALLVPFYIFASCRSIRRHSDRRTWLTYAPFLLWLLALVTAALANAAVFDSDAPIFFRPDQWF